MKKTLSTIFFFVSLAFGAMAQNLADYQGTFKLEDNPYVKQVKFSLKENKLMISAEGFPDTELSAATNADEFTLGNGDGTVSFARMNGKVSACKISAQGQELKGTLMAASLDRFTGSFKMSENEYVKMLTISLAEGKLYLYSDADDSQKSLLSESKDANTFTTSVRGYDAEVIFSAEGDSVKGIKLSVAGGAVVLTGSK